MKYFSKNFLITILGLVLFISGIRLIYSGLSSVKAKGDITTKVIELSSVDSILINGNIETRFFASEKNQLSITTHENIHPLIAIQQKGKSLSIYPLKNIAANQLPQLSLHIPSLHLLHLKGNTTTTYPVNLSKDSLHILTEGNTKLHLVGNGNTLHIDTYGNSHIDAKAAQFKALYFKTHGNSKSDFFVTEKAEGVSHGLSKITIKGTAKEIEIQEIDASKITIQ